MIRIPRTRRPFVVALVLAVVLVTTTSCSSSSDGDKTAFCRINGDLINKTTSLQSADDAIAAFKSVQNQFASYISAAPSEVKPDAQKLVDAANHAVATNDPSQFQNDNSLAQAADRIAKFCGQVPSSSSSSS